MKRITLTFLALACGLFGCQQAELIDPNDNGAVQMKTVTISAGIDNTDTKASLDSKTGAFTWQSGDLISVLATDGNFYDFILEGEFGAKKAEFVGNIPTSANVTTVATYPRIVADGTANTVLTGNTLNYVLPATWNYAKDVSNVPMVATFGEGADYMSFKQVGGVMRFPVRNLPREAQFVVTMNDKTITGQFPVDITALGETCMAAGTAASELVINYTSDVDGAYAEFNVPVPTGVYNNFTVTIKDTEGNELFAKNYSAENKVERATLLNMKELVLPERPMVISEVWPFFVDARVVFAKYEGVEKYAFYIDGSEEPVIKDAEDLDDKAGALIGGTFGHNTTHTVAVAKVVDGEPVVTSKSAAVTFTTGDIHQLTTNTGTKFVSVGWDDVAIGWGPEYDPVTKRWSVVSKAVNPDDVSIHYKRGYNVQLLASDKETVIYDIIPFDGHAAFTGLFSDSSWLGMVNNENIMIPTALSFGWLDPGKDYYFRVKTLDGVVNIGSVDNKEKNVIQGNYNPEDGGKYPVPYPLHSDRGGCAWSELVKLSTDNHVPGENEVFYEGFDDMMVHSDYMNWSSAVVPNLGTERTSWNDYIVNMPEAYTTFLTTSASERKWTCEAFSQQIRIDYLGVFDTPFVKNEYRLFNENAGSLAGWAIQGTSEKRTAYPIFGAIRLGQSGSNENGAILLTPAIYSDKLYDEFGTKAIITVKVAYSSTGIPEVNLPTIINIQQYRGDSIQFNEDFNISTLYPEEWDANNSASVSATDYAHHQQYYTVTAEIYLRNGDQLAFSKPKNASKLGMLVIGEVQVEIVPNAFEPDVELPYDMGIGTEPDDTDYDIFGFDEIPITYYHGAPTRAYTKVDPITGQSYYDYEATKSILQDIKNIGINLITYTGTCDYSIEENKRLLGICEELGIKFISASYGGHAFSMDWIAKVKENLYDSPAYAGDFLRDEPNASEFDSMGEYVKEFMRQMPDKEVYTNLFPDYAKPQKLGVGTYEEYFDQYISKVPSKMYGFDYYGLGKDAKYLRPGYYTNYDFVRARALENRKPYMAITAAGGVGTIKQPTETELRWEVWSSIAMGSKGISYFTYWTPDSGGGLDNNVYIVDRDGTKTEMYGWVKQINSDINTIGKKLIHCHADGAIINGITAHPLYENTGNGRTKYGPIKSVGHVKGNYLVGCFRDARISEKGDNYKGYKVLVTPKLPARGSITADLEIDMSVSQITLTHNNIEKIVTLENTLNDNLSGVIGVSYTGGVLTLKIPEGEAVLLEF